MAKSAKKLAAETETRHQRAIDIAKKFPRHEADSFIMQRFNFEPRSDGMGHRWLVVKDRLTEKYLLYPASRSYLKFSDSQNAIDYLRSRFVPSGKKSEDVAIEKEEK